MALFQAEILILYAVYMPEKIDQFYPLITPVNTFRNKVLNYVLGTNYPLLNDVSHFSNVNKAPFRLQETEYLPQNVSYNN